MTPNAIPQKSGLLGGTFDPVTTGHLHLAQSIQKNLNLDRIWFIPAWQSPHKLDRPPTDATHRLNMLKQALTPFPHFQISEIELGHPRVSYTINTLTALHNRHPDTEWYLILGRDTFRDFASWKSCREILEKAHVVVATRPGYGDALAEKALQNLMEATACSFHLDHEAHGLKTYLCGDTGKTLIFCDIEPVDVSSSEIRERVRRGLSVKNLLPPEVERYIMSHHLYQAIPQPRSE